MLLQLSRISESAVDELSPSFDNLPETDHLDGKYRLRRYSVVKCSGNCVEAGDNTFIQSDKYNKFQGNVLRKFDPIESDVISSLGMLEICSVFTSACGLPSDQEIGIHQMRIITLEDKSKVSSEGVHQDGFDYISMVGIKRHYILGGKLLVHSDPEEKPFLSIELGAGLAVTLNDRLFWHDASNISPETESQGHMDTFILTAKE